ncbi:hypothetical protein VP01_369g2, partial [Puccinia sorghi]
MSSPQALVPTESTAAPAPTESLLPAPVEATVAAEKATDSSAAAGDKATTGAAEAEVAATPAPVEPPVVEESKPADESKPAEGTHPADEPQSAEAAKPEDKKEKKQGRKPFSDLLNKILKPHPQATEKKLEGEAPTSPEGTTPEAAAPVTETPVAQPDATADAAQPAASSDAPAEAPKDATTPRKERGNILDKIQAFVLKPMSPKLKKPDGPKEDGDEAKTEVPTAEAGADAQRSQ